MSGDVMMKWVIGIDGGGTKTVGCAAAVNGKILGQVEKGPGNYHITGVAKFTAVISGIIDELAVSCNLKKADLLVVSLGLAGADRVRDREVVLEALAELGLPCCYLVNSDAKIALVAGLGKAEGIVLIAGTGSIAYGINRQGAVIRAGGWGHLASDEGSGYAIGRQAVERGIRAAEGRDKATIVLDMIMEYAGLKSWNDMIGYINNQTTSKGDIAAFARVVGDAAKQGDQVAIEIVKQAGDALASLVESVITRGFGWREAVQVCMYGGIVTNILLVRERLVEVLAKRASIVACKTQPVEGAVRLGLEWLQNKV
ncbi:BadF/BadG/BcrA/BcrD ATPase family protein [Sporomusa ovata]|nr:BadF/BadG/BcrA/BcrD ATPase family protein [Sporomusa ovata]